MENKDDVTLNKHQNRRHQFDPDRYSLEFFGVHRKLEPYTSEENTSDDQPIEWLNLNVRTYNCLARAGIRLISQLKRLRATDVLTLPHFTEENLEDLQRQLVEKGFTPLD